jgi:hypothetical protein
VSLVDKLLLACVFVQVLLTFGILIRLGQERVRLVTERTIKMRDIALSREPWPPKAQQLANAFDNQFQLPVLFYVGVLLTLWSGVANWLLLILAIAFAACRLVHAGIHISSNRVQARFLAYTASFAVLFAYWLVLAIAMLAMPGAA